MEALKVSEFQRGTHEASRLVSDQLSGQQAISLAAGLIQ